MWRNETTNVFFTTFEGNVNEGKVYQEYLILCVISLTAACCAITHSTVVSKPVLETTL